MDSSCVLYALHNSTSCYASMSADNDMPSKCVSQLAGPNSAISLTPTDSIATQISSTVSESKPDNSKCLVCANHVIDDKCKQLCARCGKFVHTACVIKQYNVMSGTALRNSVQWMHDFVHFEHLRKYTFRFLSTSRIQHH